MNQEKENMWKGYVFLSIATKFGDRYSNKLMGTATKTEIDAGEIASTKIVQKTPEERGDFWNKIADKVISVNKSKSKEMKHMK